MVKSFVILINFFVLSLLNIHIGENVSTSMYMPSNVTAGQDFIVKITVDKGDIQNFSRFQQPLPYGLKASPVNTSNGEFKFENQTVKLIWLNIPQASSFTFSYAVRVNKFIKGNVNLSGEFAYIENNERKSTNIEPQNLKIEPDPTVDPALVMDIKEYQKKFINQDLNESVAAIRQTPRRAPGSDAIDVTLVVHKENLNQFAKIEEKIPSGYTAKELNSRNGIFIFKEGAVKFLWMQLPAKDNFTVSYRLYPKPENKQTTPEIDGEFSYIQGESTHKVNTIQRDINLDAIDPDDNLNELLAKATGESELLEVQTSEPDNNEIRFEDEPKEESGDATTAAEEKNEEVIEEQTEALEEQQETEEVVAITDDDVKPVKNDTKQPQNNNTQSNNKTYNRINANKTDKSHMLEPQSGIYYRIQVAAGHRPVNVDRYFNRYKLQKEVKRERHEGWYKYSVGSFNIYKEARDYRVNIWNTTEIDDAFVTAYNNGVRITVQEALMVTNQKWYK
jgi:hypothetical protein